GPLTVDPYWQSWCYVGLIVRRVAVLVASAVHHPLRRSNELGLDLLARRHLVREPIKSDRPGAEFTPITQRRKPGGRPPVSQAEVWTLAAVDPFCPPLSARELPVHEFVNGVEDGPLGLITGHQLSTCRSTCPYGSTWSAVRCSFWRSAKNGHTNSQHPQ